MPNYATKTETSFDTLGFAKKTDLANLKSDADKLDNYKLKNVSSSLSSLKGIGDKLDIGKIETTLADVSKLSNVVKNEVVKKTPYNKLVKKVNNININETSNLILKN